MIAELGDQQVLKLDAREVLPLEACPACRPRSVDAAAVVPDLREHHGSVTLQHRAGCSAKGRDPAACVCDPRAYLCVDHKQTPAGRLPPGWGDADIADLYARLPRRRRRANAQLQHRAHCPAKGRDHERCACSPRAYVNVSGSTVAGRGRLPQGWGPDDIAALIEPFITEPAAPAATEPAPAEAEAYEAVDDHAATELRARKVCTLCRGRGEIGEPIDGSELYAIDAEGAVRAIATVTDRVTGDALHRPHTAVCAAQRAACAVAA